MAASLQPSRHQQDDHDDGDEPDTAARIVAPGAAVWPRRDRAEQEKDEDDEEDCSSHWTPMLYELATAARDPPKSAGAAIVERHSPAERGQNFMTELLWTNLTPVPPEVAAPCERKPASFEAGRRRRITRRPAAG